MKVISVVAGACAAAFVAAAIPVLAQIAPGDSGAGVQRGMQDMNFSGQVGTVTTFHASSGNGTLVVIRVQGQPAGRVESASIQRGKSCSDSEIEPHPVFMLNDVTNGRSATVINIPEDRLLSGNYVAIVHAGQLGPTNGMNGMHMQGGAMSHGNMSGNMMAGRARWTPILCGHLYSGS